MRIETIHLFKMLIAQLGITLVLLAGVYDYFRLKAGRWLLTAGFSVLALFAAGAYFDFGFYAPWGWYVNTHDVFHYYLGSKYFPELGYYDLYNCAVSADSEEFADYPAVRVRNLVDYSYTNARDIVANRERYRAKFSAERWEDFKADVKYLQQWMGPVKWNAVLGDKGYNPTPVWNMTAHVLTNLAPMQRNDFRLRAILLLDPLLILAMFALVWRAFGWRTCLIAVIFFGTNYFMNQTHIKGSLLRLDWVALLVMAVCLLKLGWFKTAGGLVGYAAMVRIFPVLFVVGLVAKIVWEFVEQRRISRRYIEFGAVFATVVVVLFLTSVAIDGGSGNWRTFFEKIEVHDRDIVSERVGFKYVFLGTYRMNTNTWESFRVLKMQEFKNRKVLWYAIQILVLGVVGFFARRLEDHETIPYSFIAAYFLTAPTFYYYVMLVVPLLFFAPRMERPQYMAGATMVLLISVLGYVLEHMMRRGLVLHYILSLTLLLICVYMLFLAAARYYSWGWTAVPSDLSSRVKSPRKA